jgi:hypothetical protein
MINNDYEKIKINKDYIMIDLNYQMEIVMDDCNPYDIGIQNGRLLIDHSVYNVRFESKFLPYGEITSIIIEDRSNAIPREELLDKSEDMGLVKELKMRDFLSKNKDF